MYKTFTEWKNGNWLEDGEPRKEAYTKDELLLVEMGWKYGFDAGKALKADRIAELEKVLEHEGISVGRDLLNGGVALSKKLPQTKPLSDEEIFDLTTWKKNPYELYVEMEKEDMIAFARAIEERHGIK